MTSEFDTVLQVKRYLSIRKTESGDLLLGFNPPVGMTIKQPPAYLAALLECFQTPCTSLNALATVQNQFPTCDIIQVAGAVLDLLKIGVLGPPSKRAATIDIKCISTC